MKNSNKHVGEIKITSDNMSEVHIILKEFFKDFFIDIKISEQTSKNNDCTIRYLKGDSVFRSIIEISWREQVQRDLKNGDIIYFSKTKRTLYTVSSGHPKFPTSKNNVLTEFYKSTKKSFKLSSVLQN